MSPVSFFEFRKFPSMGTHKQTHWGKRCCAPEVISCGLPLIPIVFLLIEHDLGSDVISFSKALITLSSRRFTSFSHVSHMKLNTAHSQCVESFVLFMTFKSYVSFNTVSWGKQFILYRNACFSNTCLSIIICLLIKPHKPKFLKRRHILRRTHNYMHPAPTTLQGVCAFGSLC